MDWTTRQWRVQIAVYSLYRRLISRPWRYPVISSEFKRYRVTKSMSGIGVRLFGRTLWLLVPMVIEREENDTTST